jgi:putative inorganic carbon (HCO3(-)) transporter
MRDAVFFLVFLPMPFASFLYPWCGLLLWCWIAFAGPQRDLWSFAAGIPYNEIIAIATLAGWALSREKKSIPIDATAILLLLLAIVLGVSTAASLAPAVSMERFQLCMKSWVLLLLVPAFLTSRVRVHAFVWMMAFCVGHFGVEGGALFLITAGQHHFKPPAGFDNNYVAVALVTAMPLMNYLRLQSQQFWIRLGVTAAMILTALAVVGTYSRGGFVALGVMASMLFWKSRGKVMIILIVAVASIFIVKLGAEQWTQRIGTIQNAQNEDESFQSRVVAWQVYFNAGLARPLTGAGLWALETQKNYDRYYPEHLLVDYKNRKAHAAHSIYFEMLGEVGVIGLGLYLALVAMAWHNAGWVRRRSSQSVEFAWMGDLARMGQVSIVAFSVGGAAVSIAFYDYFLVLLVTMATLRRLLKATQSAPSPARFRRAAGLQPAGSLPSGSG